MTSTEKVSYIRNEAGAFVCPHCGETKARQNTMYYHMKKHAPLTDHVCPHCDKGFVQRSALQIHIAQVHSETGEKPTKELACPCCEHTTKMKANLLIHLARKHCPWIPAAGKACSGCNKEMGSPTAYYYHSLQCLQEKATKEMLAIIEAIKNQTA